MTVASRVPCLNAFIASTMAPARRPARGASTDPGAGRPSSPWHMAQPDASARTPDSERLGAANAVAASWAMASPAARIAARPSAPRKKNAHLEGGRLDCGMVRGLRRLDRLGRLLRGLRDVELDLAILVEIDRHASAVGELAEEELVGERAADRVLDEARHRARAHLRIEAVLREVLLQALGEERLDFLLR